MCATKLWAITREAVMIDDMGHEIRSMDQREAITGPIIEEKAGMKDAVCS